MNIRKPTDYKAMYTELDRLMATGLPQMRLYFEIGKVVNARTEKGAAVAASEYLQQAFPKSTGFSPRNLRRMREFYRTYEDSPELAEQAMKIGWTQNVVILEAELNSEERCWYLHAVKQFNWSKMELLNKIDISAHLETVLDKVTDKCYTDSEDTSLKCSGYNQNSISLLYGDFESCIGQSTREKTVEKYCMEESIFGLIFYPPHQKNWHPCLYTNSVKICLLSYSPKTFINATDSLHHFYWKYGMGVLKMSNHAFFRFYTELQEMEPKVRRLFQIDASATFLDLVFTIMTLFEMRGSHQFEFQLPGGNALAQRRQTAIMCIKLLNPKCNSPCHTILVIVGKFNSVWKSRIWRT